MIVGKLSDTHRGWVIGDFEPSLLKTKDFEVGILTHLKGEVWPAHYHKKGTEYNILIKGTMNVCDTELTAGDTLWIYDVSRYALGCMQQIIEEWDGTDFKKFANIIILLNKFSTYRLIIIYA